MKIDKVLLESVEYMAERGFHASTISNITGLSKSQVYYRVHTLGMTLRSYRDGQSKQAKAIIGVTPCVKVHIKAERGSKYIVKPFLKHDSN